MTMSNKTKDTTEILKLLNRREHWSTLVPNTFYGVTRCVLQQTQFGDSILLSVQTSLGSEQASNKKKKFQSEKKSGDVEEFNLYIPGTRYLKHYDNLQTMLASPVGLSVAWYYADDDGEIEENIVKTPAFSLNKQKKKNQFRRREYKFSNWDDFIRDQRRLSRLQKKPVFGKTTTIDDDDEDDFDRVFTFKKKAPRIIDEDDTTVDIQTIEKNDFESEMSFP